MIELIHNPSSAYYNKNIKIILITPPPVHEEMWKIECAKSNLPMNRSNELAKLYADAVVEVGKKYKVPVVNIYDRIIAEIQNYRASHLKSEASEGNSVQQGSGDDMEKGRWFGFEQFLYDGLHLNGRGNTILTEMILGTIATHFPELHHRKLKPVVPTIYEAIEFYDKLSKMHIKSKL
ncbi:Isoamyl acetate-hydrolyzing esterase-like protein [Zancudomyces culisetae]|uniref:Isoamyl acetate-hydrolyzing esterase-like protein n=1 Tax=Zancudomyces culisetae TaxID=1213189 RepID=A0A1R1PLU5_ZANCU|nr:Isoamyl acetate-hydrolyzing esterase-like protein [Zancudomyces culisetae]|eukprot:OMH81940.1 Isoamyl acetate-hydrolyzing esterase-like protein [Zancudomyces culisetae]